MEPILFITPGACSLGSQITLEWLQIPYKIGVTTPEIRASEAFRAISPNGQVGALKDGEQLITENLAILLYLADKYNATTICPGLGNPARSKVYQWLSYLSSTLHTTFGQVLFPAKFIAQNQVDEFRKLAVTRLLNILSHIDKNLNKDGYFITGNPTVVDAQAYGLIRWAGHLNDLGVNLDNFPKIKKFMTLMENNPAVKNALAIENSNTGGLVNSKFAGYFSFS